jgi:serine/threonine protein kinase
MLHNQKLRFFKTSKSTVSSLLNKKTKSITVPEGTPLGQGCEKIVFLSQDLLRKQSWAVGIIHLETPDDFSDKVADISEEFKAGQELRDIPHLYPLEAVANNGSRKIFTISQECQGKGISPEFLKLPQKDAQNFVLTLINSIALMHEKGWIHQDLHRNNTLISLQQPYTPSIIDFALAQKITETHQDTKGTNGGILRDLYLLQNLIKRVTRSIPATKKGPCMQQLEVWHGQQIPDLGCDPGIYPTPEFLKGKFTTFVRDLHTELTTLFEKDS